jgi:AraC-like DNA-binding protein
MHKLTRMARIELRSGGGGFDALSAQHFTRRFPPHFHDTFAVGVVEWGWAHLRTRRGEWTGGPGTILAFAPGEVHSADPVTANGYSYRMVYPTTGFMRALGFEAPPTFTSPVIQDADLARALHSAHLPLMNGIVGQRAESRLLDALQGLVRRHVSARDENARTGDGDAPVVERARAMLHEKFAQRLSLPELARFCGVSPFQLIRRFRRVLGVTPFAYLAQFRVNRAQAMLCKGGALSDVAYSCGFSDQSHMTRAFRESLGLPPGEYARSVLAHP